MTDTTQVLEPGETGRNCSFPAAWRAVRSARYIINILLACIAVALEVYYSICGGSCSYLKGDLIGIPLQYVGIAYMASIMLLSLLKADTLILTLLSAGLGIESYLVGFQFWYHTFCLYCLAFGAVIFILFLLNFSWAKKWLSIVSLVLALVLFSLFFEGSVTPSYAEETIIPSFGQGKINVRLYTDYFCPPCRAMEPEVEPLLAELVKKNKINLTFIDTPLYPYSSLYARYYLYAMNGRREFEHALTTRGVLMEVAKQNVKQPGKLETMLGEKGIQTKAFDAKPVFDVFGKFLRDDEINSTPTCVVERDGKKEKASGKAEIINSLKALK